MFCRNMVLRLSQAYLQILETSEDNFEMHLQFYQSYDLFNLMIFLESGYRYYSLKLLTDILFLLLHKIQSTYKSFTKSS